MTKTWFLDQAEIDFDLKPDLGQAWYRTSHLTGKCRYILHLSSI